MRPLASVTGTRCTRCTPLSNFSCLYTSVPEMRKITSLYPPRSETLLLIGWIFQPWASEYFEYIRCSSAANRLASSPPVPARISITVLRESVDSGGIIARRTCPVQLGAATLEFGQFSGGEFAQFHIGSGIAAECLGLGDLALDFLVREVVRNQLRQLLVFPRHLRRPAGIRIKGSIRHLRRKFIIAALERSEIGKFIHERRETTADICELREPPVALPMAAIRARGVFA
jgi:hypothetical protein